MREFLCWAPRHCRIDMTHLLVHVQTDAKIFRKGPNARFITMTSKICGTVRREERHQSRQGPASCSHQHTDHRGSHAHTRKTYCVDGGIYIDSVPREIFNVLEATRSASADRDEELSNFVLKDTTITKRQLDHATRLMLEQVSRLSHGNYEQSQWSIFPGLRSSCDRAINSNRFVPRAMPAFQR